jgi:hypothetical protein
MLIGSFSFPSSFFSTPALIPPSSPSPPHSSQNLKLCTRKPFIKVLDYKTVALGLFAFWQQTFIFHHNLETINKRSILFMTYMDALNKFFFNFFSIFFVLKFFLICIWAWDCTTRPGSHNLLTHCIKTYMNYKFITNNRGFYDKLRFGWWLLLIHIY